MYWILVSILQEFSVVSIAWNFILVAQNEREREKKEN